MFENSHQLSFFTQTFLKYALALWFIIGFFQDSFFNWQMINSPFHLVEPGKPGFGTDPFSFNSACQFPFKMAFGFRVASVPVTLDLYLGSVSSFTREYLLNACYLSELPLSVSQFYSRAFSNSVKLLFSVLYINLCYNLSYSLHLVQ